MAKTLDIPRGFILEEDEELGSDLPKGFVLEEEPPQKLDLPKGFFLEEDLEKLPEDVRKPSKEINVSDLLTPVSVAARISPEQTLQVAAGVAEKLPFGHVQRALESVEDNPVFGGLAREAQRGLLPVEFTRSIRKAAGEEIGIERKIGQVVGDLGSLSVFSALTAPIAGAVAVQPIFRMLPRFQSVARFAGARMAQSGSTFGLNESLNAITDLFEGTQKLEAKGIAKRIFKATAFGTGLGAVGSIASPLLRIPAEMAYGYSVAKMEDAENLDAGLQGAMFGLFGLINQKNLSNEYKMASLIGLRQAVVDKASGLGQSPEAVSKFTDRIVNWAAGRIMKNEKIKASDVDAFVREFSGKEIPVKKSAEPVKPAELPSEVKPQEPVDIKGRELQVFDEYTKRFGDIVSTDNMRYLISKPGIKFSNDPEQKTARDLQRKLTDRYIDANKGTEKGVIVTTGGSGVAKSTIIQKYSDPNVAFTIDTNLDNFEGASGLIDKLISNGLKPQILYVLRDPERAFMQGVLKRAIDPESQDYQRIVTIDAHIETHQQSKEVFRKLAEKYGDKITYKIIDNRGKIGEEKEIVLDELNAIKYDYAGLKEDLNNELRSRQDIPEEIRRAFLGEVSPARISGTPRGQEQAEPPTVSGRGGRQDQPETRPQGLRPPQPPAKAATLKQKLLEELTQEIEKAPSLAESKDPQFKTFKVRTAQFKIQYTKEALQEFKNRIEKGYTLPKGGRVKLTKDLAKLREDIKSQAISPATTPSELSKRIEQLNKFAQMQAILRRGARLKKAMGKFVRGPKLPKEGEIRISEETFLEPQSYTETLGHELGHAIEYHLLGRTSDPKFGVFGKNLPRETIVTIRQELIAVTKDLVGAQAMLSKPSYYLKPAELVARYFEKIISSPGNLENLAPTASKLIEEQAVRHPIVQEFMDAAKGTIDKGALPSGLVLFKDLRQMYHEYLGKRVGDIAYGEEVTYRAMKERGKLVIEKFINEKFKSVKDDPETLFRAAESIKITRGGVPEFGTRDFVTAKNEEDEMRLVAMDYVKMPKPVVEDGVAYPQYAKVRYTAEEGKRLFDSLSPMGKRLILDFTSERREAKDYFNREVIKEVNKVGGQIEGWVHHYFEEPPTSTIIGGRRFRKKVAGARKHREGAVGYVEDFKKAMTKALVDLEGEKVFNDFITRQFARVTEPIPEGKEPNPGWVEVAGTVRKGIGLPQEKRMVLIDKATGKTIPVRQPRYQMPAPIYERYKLWKGLVDEASLAVRIISDLNRYWRINILAHAGSAGTNFLSGAVQYSAKVLTDFYTEVLTGNVTMPQTRMNISAMIKTLLPKGWFDAPDWIYGGDLSNFYGQFGREKGVAGKAIDEYANKVLKLFSTYERYWKKVILLSENARDLKKLEQMTVEGLRLPTSEERQMIADVNQLVDLYAYDYDNVPVWLEQHQKSVLGQSIKPFAKWPYKYAKQILDLAGSVFDQTQPWQSRVSKLLALATLMGGYGYFSSQRKKKQRTPEVPEGSTVPARYQTRGRLFITTDDKGNELFVRTAKYPFFGLTDAGLNFVNGSFVATKDNLVDMFGSIAPAGDLGMLALDYRSKYDQYKKTPVLIGDTLSTYVPLTRVLSDISRMLDPFQRKQETFAQSFTRLIPTTDAELQLKLHGEIRTERVPIEGELERPPGTKLSRTTFDDDLENYWQDILLSSLTGIYVSRIDPEKVEAYLIREEKNRRESEIKGRKKEIREARLERPMATSWSIH